MPFVYAAIVTTGTRALYNNPYAGLRLQLSACCHASFMFWSSEIMTCILF